MSFEKWRKIEQLIDENPHLSAAEINELLKHHGFIKDQSVLNENVDEHTESLVRFAFEAPDLRLGTKVSKYKIKQKLTEGGQSEIYLADRADQTYDKTVVVKFINQSITEQSARQQFLGEMQILAHLRHPNIIPIADAGFEEDQRPWLVLEYIQGLHIDEAIKENQLSRNGILELFIRLGDALHHAHERKVLHLDIKPANVLVEKINDVLSPVLIDFGISQAGFQQHITRRFGTQGWSAPEVISGGQVDHRADIYSLGLMLGFLLIQQPNNLAPHSPSIKMQLEENCQFKKMAGQDLYDVIKKCTHDSPEQRYVSMRSLTTDLSHVINDFPISSKQNSLASVTVKLIKRNPFVFALGLLVLMSMLLGTLKYTHDITEQKELTHQSKQATDQLMSYMMLDLYDKLEEIGKIDLLMDINEASHKHYSNHNGILSGESQIMRAQGLMHSGRVYLELKQTKAAKQTFESSQKLLDDLKSSGFTEAAQYKLSIQNKIYLSRAHALLGEPDVTEHILYQADQEAESFSLAFPELSAKSQWLVSSDLAWFYIESGDKALADSYINRSLLIAQQNTQIKANPVVTSFREDWGRNLSKVYRMMAWYELDFNDSVENAIVAINQALNNDRLLLSQKPENTYALDDLRTTLNMSAFFHLQLNQFEQAKAVLQEAITTGELLNLRIPTNMTFKRALSYSYSHQAEALLEEGKNQAARTYIEKTLAISKQILEIDKNNHSAVNDYAVDLITASKLDESTGETKQAEARWDEALLYMEPIINQTETSKYYLATYAYLLVKKQRISQAQQIADKLSSMKYEDETLSQLFQANNINFK
jgi:tRNA A-37 threonylcarbamoyl transferase component Bud32/tetratricopeptide (TPR) repeat protein